MYFASPRSASISAVISRLSSHRVRWPNMKYSSKTSPFTTNWRSRRIASTRDDLPDPLWQGQLKAGRFVLEVHKTTEVVDIEPGQHLNQFYTVTGQRLHCPNDRECVEISIRAGRGIPGGAAASMRPAGFPARPTRRTPRAPAVSARPVRSGIPPAACRLIPHRSARESVRSSVTDNLHTIRSASP